MSFSFLKYCDTCGKGKHPLTTLECQHTYCTQDMPLLGECTKCVSSSLQSIGEKLSKSFEAQMLGLITGSVTETLNNSQGRSLTLEDLKKAVDNLTGSQGPHIPFILSQQDYDMFQKLPITPHIYIGPNSYLKAPIQPTLDSLADSHSLDNHSPFESSPEAPNGDEAQ